MPFFYLINKPTIIVESSSSLLVIKAQLLSALWWFCAGKTAFLNMFSSGKLVEVDECAMIHCLDFSTNTGNITFDCWDCSGEFVKDVTYMNADCAIIFFDVTSKKTNESVQNRQIHANDMIFHRINNLQYYEISAVCNYNLDKPFLYFAKVVTKGQSSEFVVQPPLIPPDFFMDNAAQKQIQDDLTAAAAEPDDGNYDVEMDGFELMDTIHGICHNPNFYFVKNL
ncbi:unnamed protein product [Thlaspi arvense]|uniref:Uncharacterized protein n=1 Tax=Thlaspi arvense TaxID=13288 RepID=A0AAU9RR34_THLAR|nr:unnamed protein product [Thlaspi arvense]